MAESRRIVVRQLDEGSSRVPVLVRTGPASGRMQGLTPVTAAEWSLIDRFLSKDEQRVMKWWMKRRERFAEETGKPVIADLRFYGRIYEFVARAEARSGYESRIAEASAALGRVNTVADALFEVARSASEQPVG